MKSSGWMIVMLLAVVLTGCGDDPASVPLSSGTPVRDPSDSAAQRSEERVEIHGAQAGAEPLLVGPGGIVSTQVPAPQAGDVTGAGVQVGNFGGTSDGIMTIRLCEAERCVEGSSDLSASVDNEYLMVSFASPFTLTLDTPLTISIGRVGGTGQFALWTYPATTTLTAPDGVTSQKAPKVALAYLK